MNAEFELEQSLSPALSESTRIDSEVDEPPNVELSLPSSADDSSTSLNIPIEEEESVEEFLTHFSVNLPEVSSSKRVKLDCDGCGEFKKNHLI
jgi:hypothetical protein